MTRLNLSIQVLPLGRSGGLLELGPLLVQAEAGLLERLVDLLRD
ncbi:hypothetical protein [Xylella fastidiosa]|nr:hypothetical protein [Xylella fastidiosa]WDF06052.1 hypothetical protein PT012_06015 [Xylella fastidiosa subsp. multiplex]